MTFSRLPGCEVERRRQGSIKALQKRDREEFDRWYQEECDRKYWTLGQCCAGCDFWNSEMGWSGECRAAGLVPSDEVFASIGIVSWSGPKEPGFPLTSGDFWCGKFKDDFDWSTLDAAYLRKIGAITQEFGVKSKPAHRTEAD